MPQGYTQDDFIFSLIFEKSVEGILVTDSSGKIIRANPSCLETLGYELTEVLNEQVEKLIPTKFKDEHIQHRKAYTKSPRARAKGSSLEISGLHKSGREIPLEISLSYIESENDLLVVCFIVDVSGRKKLEYELKKERELIQQYLDVTNSIFLVLGKNEQIIMINKEGGNLLGGAVEDLKGKNWFDEFIPAPERESVREVFRQMMKGVVGNTLSNENEVIGPDGELRLIEWHSTLLKSKSGQPEATLSSGIDITEKRSLERGRTEALVIGQENERRRLAQELHDGLGQSISAIGLNLNALEPELKNFNEKFKKIYDEVKARLSDTIEEVRTISRNLTPKILEDFGLKRALEHLCQTIDKSTEVKINLNLHGDLKRIDKKMSLGLYRIIQELMNNALRHADPQNINVHLTLGEGELICLVEDDGHGFDLSAKSEGMGLSNVHSRVELLKGALHFDSNRIGGTTVSINIPS